MDDQGLIHEIDEDVARKRALAYWKTYGNYIIGAAAAIVLSTAGITAWNSYKQERDQQATSDLITIIDAKESSYEDKMKAAESYAEKQGQASHVALAKLHAASYALDAGKKDKAIEIYNELAADEAIEKVYRELADLLAVQVQLDDAEPAKLLERLKPLMSEDSAWRVAAYEYAGFLSLKTGDRAKAKEFFQKLDAIEKTPGEYKLRAKDMLRWLEQGA